VEYAGADLQGAGDAEVDGFEDIAHLALLVAAVVRIAEAERAVAAGSPALDLTGFASSSSDDAAPSRSS
jgi:hypothetical protein